jgi:hypothetical protein
MTLAPNAPLSLRDTNHQTPASRIRAYSERGFPFPRARRASQPAVLHSYSTAHSTHSACALRKTLEENHPAQPSQQASQQARQGKASKQASKHSPDPLFARSRPLAKKPHAQVYHELIRRLPTRVALRALEG